MSSGAELETQLVISKKLQLGDTEDYRGVLEFTLGSYEDVEFNRFEIKT